MKYIVNFSGGLCSFWAAHRTIAAHGKESVILLFADTLFEDSTLYDFNRQSEDLLGVHITRICEQMTPFELFRHEGLLGNDRFPICSTKLKREPLNAWMDGRFSMDERQRWIFSENATVVLGFDFTEENRVEAFKAQHPFWRVSAPMTEEPLWDKCRMMQEAEKMGLKLPRLYSLGFPHNNCGGGCVKAGISHFVHLLKVLPHVFHKWESEELLTLKEFERRGTSSGGWTILKDRRGGVPKPLRLIDLRKRVESGEKFPSDEWGGCGCGGATTPS